MLTARGAVFTAARVAPNWSPAFGSAYHVVVGGARRVRVVLAVRARSGDAEGVNGACVDPVHAVDGQVLSRGSDREDRLRCGRGARWTVGDHGHGLAEQVTGLGDAGYRVQVLIETEQLGGLAHRVELVVEDQQRACARGGADGLVGGPHCEVVGVGRYDGAETVVRLRGPGDVGGVLLDCDVGGAAQVEERAGLGDGADGLAGDADHEEGLMRR